METEELRKELLKMVETADDGFLKKVLALTKVFVISFLFPLPDG